MGFEAELEIKTEQTDIREISQAEMVKYRNNFLICLAMYLPIAFLVWILPFTGMNVVMTTPIIWNGNPCYVFVIFIFASIIQFCLGHKFYKNAYKSLKHKSANMDVLIVVSTTAAWLYGLFNIFKGYTLSQTEDLHFKHMIMNHVHNWETSSVLIMIVMLGKFIESFSKTKTIKQLSDLASLKVSKANLLYTKDVT